MLAIVTSLTDWPTDWLTDHSLECPMMPFCHMNILLPWLSKHLLTNVWREPNFPMMGNITNCSRFIDICVCQPEHLMHSVFKLYVNVGHSRERGINFFCEIHIRIAFFRSRARLKLCTASWLLDHTRILLEKVQTVVIHQEVVCEAFWLETYDWILFFVICVPMPTQWMNTQLILRSDYLVFFLVRLKGSVNHASFPSLAEDTRFLQPDADLSDSWS